MEFPGLCGLRPVSRQMPGPCSSIERLLVRLAQLSPRHDDLPALRFQRRSNRTRPRRVLRSVWLGKKSRHKWALCAERVLCGHPHSDIHETAKDETARTGTTANAARPCLRRSTGRLRVKDDLALAVALSFFWL